VAPKIKDPDQEALATGILLSKQEAQYGVNMFDSLTPQDEAVVRQHTNEGFTWEEAVFIVFRDKYVLAERASTAQGTTEIPLHNMMSLVRLTPDMSYDAMNANNAAQPHVKRDSFSHHSPEGVNSTTSTTSRISTVSEDEFNKVSGSLPSNF